MSESNRLDKLSKEVEHVHYDPITLEILKEIEEMDRWEKLHNYR